MVQLEAEARIQVYAMTLDEGRKVEGADSMVLGKGFFQRNCDKDYKSTMHIQYMNLIAFFKASLLEIGSK